MTMVVFDENGDAVDRTPDKPVAITSEGGESNQEGEYVIEIDQDELLDTVAKSVISGIATGLLVDWFVGE